jgi:GT2 family glycosyltransferase
LDIKRRFPLAVIIPTYNRADVLLECLANLERQTWKDFEVVIVDDGSTDSTVERLKAYLVDTPLAVRYSRLENGGPARARNHAISMIDALVCLMIGDDIFASPALVAEHMRLHIRRPEDSVAGLGLSRWSATGQEVTPFMDWLERGAQFNYDPLLLGQNPDWTHFYTSNISLKTSVLKSFQFDESFPYAAMEDMELACRLEARIGLEMIFLPEALAFHLHPTTFGQACRRMIMVGESTAHFDRIWPGKRPVKQNPVKSFLQAILVAHPQALSFLVQVADWSLKVTCPNALMRYVLSCHFALGYQRRIPHTL